MKTKEEILFEQNNNGIKFKWYKDSDIVSVMPIVGTDVALKAMEEYAKAYHEDLVKQPPQPTGRPIREWLNELDEPERSQALENAEVSERNSIEIIVYSKVEAINQGFWWADTPEDQDIDYWINIQDKYFYQ